MADDPFTVAGNVSLDDRRDRRIDGNLVRCLICLAVVVGGLCWTFRKDFSRKPAVPAQADNQTHQTKALQDAAPSVQPEPARRYGVKVGDTVEISALKPPVAAHGALITGMNDDQLTIRVGSDTFAIRWENIDRLKAEGK
ncbi:MAG TPA: hypothetical protein VMF08_22075 [Candidatus Sulfotelmatobacter sp.]|nr:hypothetical protein [Candidatus Sulfotelmatobacter sp.]